MWEVVMQNLSSTFKWISVSVVVMHTADLARYVAVLPSTTPLKLMGEGVALHFQLHNRSRDLHPLTYLTPTRHHPRLVFVVIFMGLNGYWHVNLHVRYLTANMHLCQTEWGKHFTKKCSWILTKSVCSNKNENKRCQKVCVSVYVLNK